MVLSPGVGGGESPNKTRTKMYGATRWLKPCGVSTLRANLSNLFYRNNLVLKLKSLLCCSEYIT